MSNGLNFVVVVISDPTLIGKCHGLFVGVLRHDYCALGGFNIVLCCHRTDHRRVVEGVERGKERGRGRRTVEYGRKG